jgi:hypothetical protein
VVKKKLGERDGKMLINRQKAKEAAMCYCTIENDNIL